MRDKSHIIDSIYEAAIVPDLWVRVIELIADYTGCYGGSLFSVGSGGTMMTASRNCEPHLHALLNEGWASRNIRAQRLVDMARNGFVTDHDLCTQEEIETHEIFTHFLRPRGLGWGIGTHIVGAGGDIAVFSLDQLYDRGPVSSVVRNFLDEIRPHIARSAMLATQFRMERVKGTLSSLDMLGIPAAAVTRNGNVTSANNRFHNHEGEVFTGAFNKLVLRDRSANTLMEQAISQLHLHKIPRSIPLISASSEAPLVVHIIPIERQARDIFSSTDAIVVIVPISFPGLPFKALAQSLYDLTHSEARVCRGPFMWLFCQRYRPPVPA
ncbi:MAG: hypothetical protein KL863_27715 [Rhizobium sp.]|nr:hypothetical protein [Rhizobium sp.]